MRQCQWFASIPVQKFRKIPENAGKCRKLPTLKNQRKSGEKSRKFQSERG